MNGPAINHLLTESLPTIFCFCSSGCSVCSLDSVRRVYVVLYVCENCSVGPMNISHLRYLLFYFIVLLFLTSIIRSVAMHAFSQEEEEDSLSLSKRESFSVVHDFESFCWKRKIAELGCNARKKE